MERTNRRHRLGLRSPKPSTLGPTRGRACFGRQRAANGNVPIRTSPWQAIVACNGLERGRFLQRGGRAAADDRSVCHGQFSRARGHGSQRNARASRVAFWRLRRTHVTVPGATLAKVRWSQWREFARRAVGGGRREVRLGPWWWAAVDSNPYLRVNAA